MDDILDLLWQSVQVAKDCQVSAVAWAGDIFHSKAPGRTSHRLVQRIIDVGRGYEVPWYIVPGNHDLQHDRLESIDETQPLGVLYRSGARMLAGRCQEFPHIYGVPWQQEWTNEAVGEALRKWREDEYAGHMGRAGGGLVVAHAPLFPPGLEPPWEHFDAVMWSAAMGHLGSCFYGHIHEWHGVWDAGVGVRFCNHGAISRGSLHESELTRDVYVTIWDSLDGSFTPVRLNAKPASEVFRLREKQQAVDATGKLDAFMSGIGSASLEVLSAEAVMAHVRSLNLDSEDLAEVSELLDWASHQ